MSSEAGRPDDVAISVRNVSKCYFMYARPQDRLKQATLQKLRRLLGRTAASYYREFWAVRNVSFEVKRGETVGIVGRNGAGKSTLLQMICGTLYPTGGSVEVNGRVAALLELGAGFNPEFTGRENVYLYAGILGLEHKEIQERFEDIAAFAEIGDFMEQPVKTYSSGMFVRLAFAVSACIDPDILIVDEALAVGDAKFQARCFRRLEELAARGTSILFVSHSMEMIVRHCDRAVLMENGSVEMTGEPGKVANRYLDLVFGVERRKADDAEVETVEVVEDREPEESAPSDHPSGKFEERPGYNKMEYRWGSRDAEIMDFEMRSDGGPHTTQLVAGAKASLTVWVRFHKETRDPIFGLTIKTPDGVVVTGSNSRDVLGSGATGVARKGEWRRVTFGFDQRLAPGEYLLSVGVAEDVGGEIIALDRRFDSVHVAVPAAQRKLFGLVDFGMEVAVR